MTAHQWTFEEVEASLSKVIDIAHSDGPQTITRNGRPIAVIVAAKEWERKTRRVGNLAEFFAASPLCDSGLQIKRLPGCLRKIEK